VKRLILSVSLLIFLAVPTHADIWDWMDAQSAYLNFTNAESMTEQQDHGFYEKNTWMWGDHPSNLRIFAVKAAKAYIANTQVGKPRTFLSKAISLVGFGSLLYYNVSDMREGYVDGREKTLGGHITIWVHLPVVTKSTIHWDQLEDDYHENF
jgi:hypothetical protein